MMIVVDLDVMLILVGIGDVFELEEGVVGIGLGGNYVLVVVWVFYDFDLSVEDIVKKVMVIVVDICIYINLNVMVEKFVLII